MALRKFVSFIARRHLIPCYAEIVLGSRPLDGVSLPVADGKRGLIGGDGLVEVVPALPSPVAPYSCHAMPRLFWAIAPIDGSGASRV